MMALGAGIMFTLLALFLGDSAQSWHSSANSSTGAAPIGWSWSAKRPAASNSSNAGMRSSGASSKATVSSSATTASHEHPAGRQRRDRSVPVLRLTTRRDRTTLPRLGPGRGGPHAGCCGGCSTSIAATSERTPAATP
jgi:hypothetical protein